MDDIILNISSKRSIFIEELNLNMKKEFEIFFQKVFKNYVFCQLGLITYIYLS